MNDLKYEILDAVTQIKGSTAQDMVTFADILDKHHKEHICQECGKPLDFKCINYKCDLSPEVSSKKEHTTDDPCSWRHVPGEVCKNCGMES